MRRTLIAARTLTVLALASFGATSALASPAQDLFNQATFYVGFYYSGPNKVANYRDLRKQYQAKLDTACAGDANCSYQKAFPVVQEIITTLGDPFVRVVGVNETERLPSGLGPLEPRIGAVTRAAPGGLFVARVMIGEVADGPLVRGDLIKTINGQPATPEALVRAELDAKPIALEVTRKGASQVVNLTAKVAEEGQKPGEVEGAPKGVMVIHISDYYWSGEVARKVHQLVRKANNNGYKGIVLDLRDDAWGFDSESVFAARAFTDQIAFAYKNRFQGGQRSFIMQGNTIAIQVQNRNLPIAQFEGGAFQNWKGTVTVLVNKFTTHNGEMLAYLLQHAKRAQVIGDPSSGQLGVSGGLPSLDVSIGDTQMIDGSYINISNDRILNTDGTPWPMQVTPDISIPEDANALAAGTDAALVKAIELLGVK
jgi:carboxyl-terminal processing protease